MKFLTVKRITASLTLASALSLSGMSGCTNHAMMEQHMESMKMEMMMMVDEAMRKANTADYNAGVAKSMADEAMNKTEMMNHMMMKKGMEMEMMK